MPRLRLATLLAVLTLSLAACGDREQIDQGNGGGQGGVNNQKARDSGQNGQNNSQEGITSTSP